MWYVHMLEDYKNEYFCCQNILSRVHNIAIYGVYNIYIMSCDHRDIEGLYD